MQEAGVLLGIDNSVLHWHIPNERSGGALPDDRNFWDIIWENRKVVTGFAHTHPGSGVPGPSYTDVTTFKAIESALGKHLNWFIISSDAQVLCLYENDDRPFGGKLITIKLNVERIRAPEFNEWIRKLRELSHY